MATRRALINSAAGLAGGVAVLGALGGVAEAKSGWWGHPKRNGGDSPQTILNIAATAEVLATIVNTIGYQKVSLDAVTKRNVGAAAREELIHYNVLTSLGAKPLTKKIWVPDAVFKDASGLLNTLQVGDQIFVNAYLIATKRFAQLHKPDYAVIAAEFMGVEAVHRALARQSLGQLGNDRVFMKYEQKETAPGAPNQGRRASSASPTPRRSSRPPASASASRADARCVLRLRRRQRDDAERSRPQHARPLGGLGTPRGRRRLGGAPRGSLRAVRAGSPLAPPTSSGRWREVLAKSGAIPALSRNGDAPSRDEPGRLPPRRLRALGRRAGWLARRHSRTAPRKGAAQ